MPPLPIGAAGSGFPARKTDGMAFGYSSQTRMDIAALNFAEEAREPHGPNDLEWRLLWTKAGEERAVRDRLALAAVEVVLPMLKVRVRRWGRMVESTAPLFPCYLFVRMSLGRDLACVRYARGVRDLVRFGAEPALAPDSMVAELKRRCAGGPLELPRRMLHAGERVRVIEGPLLGLEGVFDRYLSGAERVGLLMSAIGAATRVVMPAKMVAAAG
jgi:transcriptional antiterminator RfaH